MGYGRVFPPSSTNERAERRYTPSTMNNPADDLLRISMSHGLTGVFMPWQNSVSGLTITSTVRHSPQARESHAQSRPMRSIEDIELLA
jgi:hypothetical protein